LSELIVIFGLTIH